MSEGDEDDESRSLNKDPLGQLNPLAYRIIKITSALYRLWGTIRVKQLEGWINSWRDPSMFSGVPEVGAEDCAFLTALELELKRCKGEKVTLGSMDV